MIDFILKTILLSESWRPFLILGTIMFNSGFAVFLWKQHQLSRASSSRVLTDIEKLLALYQVYPRIKTTPYQLLLIIFIVIDTYWWQNIALYSSGFYFDALVVFTFIFLYLFAFPFLKFAKLANSMVMSFFAGMWFFIFLMPLGLVFLEKILILIQYKIMTRQDVFLYFPLKSQFALQYSILIFSKLVPLISPIILGYTINKMIQKILSENRITHPSSTFLTILFLGIGYPKRILENVQKSQQIPDDHLINL